MKKVTSLVAAALSLFMSISALAFECDIKYDYENYALELSGTAQAPVSVTMSASSGGELQDGSSVLMETYDFRGYSKFSKTIHLDSGLPTGKYVVKARSNEQVFSASSTSDRLYGNVVDNKQLEEKIIYHINSIDLTKLLEDINNARTSGGNLYRVILAGKTGNDGDINRHDYCEMLGLSSGEFSVYGNYVCSQISGNYSKSPFANLNEVKAALTEYITLYAVCNKENAQAAINTIIDNAEIFGESNVTKYVSPLDENSQSRLFAIAKSFKSSGKSFSEMLPAFTALATVQAADRWQTIENVVKYTHKSVLNINYNVSNLTQVFQKMMSYTYNTVADIENNFKKADAEVNKPKSPNSSQSSSSGSFGVVPPAAVQRGEEPLGISVSFTDVQDDFWGKDAIYDLASQKIISGYPDGTYRPDNSVTRAEFVKMISVAFDLSASGSIPFTDVAKNDWCYDYIRLAYLSNLVNGVSDTIFNPTGYITRQDACTIIYRYLTQNLLLNSTIRSSFADSSSFASYAAEAIEVLAGNKIVNGVGDGTFGAESYITRAECAVLVSNCISHINGN